MISVYLGDFHYKFNGTTGILINMTNGIQVTLPEYRVILCNKSNQGILDTIKDYKNIELNLRNWEYPVK